MLEHTVLVPTKSVRQALVLTVVGLAVLSIALLHIVFGIANFQPGFPKLEGVAAIIAGASLLTLLLLARRSVHRALLTACLGTIPLAVRFAYAVPSNDPRIPYFF